MKKKSKSGIDIRKRMRSNARMKTKVSFKEILATVRKTGGRPYTVFVPKVTKVKNDRNSWKREQE